MSEYNYLKRSILFIPVKILIALAVSVAVIKAEDPIDIAIYAISAYGVLTTISYISTYVEKLLVVIIGILILSALTVILITKLPAFLILIVYLAIMILGYIIDIKKIIRFIALDKKHEKGRNLTESWAKISRISSVNGFSADEMMKNDYNASTADIKTQVIQAHLDFMSSYGRCLQTINKLNNISSADAIELKRKITPLNDKAEMIYKNEAHTLSDNDILTRLKELIKTVDNIKADAQSRIDNPTARAKKEEKPAFNFFDGCNDKESIKKRYRDLIKTYHPDQGNGSAETFKQINDQYNSLLKKY